MIPKVIHQFVGNSKSRLIEHCLKTWHTIDDLGFEIRYWDDLKLEDFLTENYPFALSAFKTARNYAEAADIARYLVIYHLGGYYIDWDVELVNLQDFLNLHNKHKNGFLLSDPSNKSIASECFSACAGESYLFKIADNIVDIVNGGFRHTLDTPDFSGPLRMREVFYFTKGQTKQELLNIKDVFLYDYWEIRNKGNKNPDRAMIHHWEHGWMK